MLDKKEVSTTRKLPEAPIFRSKIYSLISWLGLGLVTLAGLAWLVVFPTAQLIQAVLTSDLSLFQPGRNLSPLEVFFRNYPQLLWLSFILGALLFFGFRPRPQSLKELPKTFSPFSLAGKTIRLPAWSGLAWRLAGIGVFGLILVLATLLRIGNAQSIGGENLIRTDYDEGVHSTAALLMSHAASTIAPTASKIQASSGPTITGSLLSLPPGLATAE